MSYQNRMGQIALAAIAAGTLSVAAYAQPHDPSDFGGSIQAASAVSVPDSSGAVAVASDAQPADPSDFGGPVQVASVARVAVEQPLQRVASLQPAWEIPVTGHGSADSARAEQPAGAPWYR